MSSSHRGTRELLVSASVSVVIAGMKHLTPTPERKTDSFSSQFQTVISLLQGGNIKAKGSEEKECSADETQKAENKRRTERKDQTQSLAHESLLPTRPRLLVHSARSSSI